MLRWSDDNQMESVFAVNLCLHKRTHALHIPRNAYTSQYPLDRTHVLGKETHTDYTLWSGTV